jgi:hypothetical protein
MEFLALQGVRMRSATAPVVLAVAAAALVSCHTITEDLPSHPSPVQVGGPGSIPVIVIPVPEQTPLPPVPSPSSPIAPAPNPRPTATPDSGGGGGGGEPPVTNTSPVAKLNAHVYFIECDGAPVPGSGGSDSAPVGCRIHFDCTARDSTNSPTVPRGNPVWTYSNPGLVNGGNTGFNPVVIAKAPGCFNYYAEVDGVRSGTSGFCIQ